MALWDLPPFPDNLLASPHPTEVPPPPTTFPLVGLLILQVSPPPGSPDPEEFYYDPSPDVTQGSFAAARAFFMAHGHDVKTLKCPDLDAFVAASPGAIIRWLSKLPVLVFIEGVSSSSRKPFLASLLQWAALCLGVAANGCSPVLP